MTLRAHLATGTTTVARAWSVARTDGVTLGFTDHDRPLSFEGVAFAPEAGLEARAVVAGTGLSVDNSEARGALSSDAITEADIDAGRYDGAEVRMWLVNWADVSERALRFRGTLGEIRRGAGAFTAELRGLSEPLNRPIGRLYQPTCAATLGDAQCGFDPMAAGLSAETLAGPTDGQTFRLALPGQAARLYERGLLTVLTGPARGLKATIKHDRPEGALRVVELWAPLRAPVGPEDAVRLDPGCDKRAETCRVRFDNMANFRGFPTIPGEDWLMAVPVRAESNEGGKLR
jgi:uncharacterized phage protein (TIGR02218 family)